MKTVEIARSAALGAIAAVLIAGGISMALSPGTVRQAASDSRDFVSFGQRHEADGSDDGANRGRGRERRRAARRRPGPVAGDGRRRQRFDAERRPRSEAAGEQSAIGDEPGSGSSGADDAPAPQTSTAVPPTATPTFTSTPEPTATPTFTPTPEPTSTPTPTAEPTEGPTLVPGPDDLAPKPTLTVVPINPCLVVDCDDPDPLPTLKPGILDTVHPKVTPAVKPDLASKIQVKPGARTSSRESSYGTDGHSNRRRPRSSGAFVCRDVAVELEGELDFDRDARGAARPPRWQSGSRSRFAEDIHEELRGAVDDLPIVLEVRSAGDIAADADHLRNAGRANPGTAGQWRGR
ncbi:MAG: hypothetical protein U5Q44_06535 [Dehalococcoidia bacterium]|nr:hypothetical protein [Dehalococcoidia bacterium]